MSSEFSEDVDTASYTRARRTLRSGHLLASGDIRVEEFLSFVDYDCRPPPASDPFAVHVQGAPSPWAADTHVLRVGLQGRRVPADQRAAVHLTFLVDTSGSMQSDDKLGLVRASLRMLVEELQDGDTVALVACAGSAGVVLEPTPMSRRDEVLSALDRLVAGGSTAMGRGISMAYTLAQSTAEAGAVNRVIIASDGDANVGTVDVGELSSFIEGHADRGITLTTLGFGTGNYQDHRIEQLANDGDGNYFYIDGPDEARRIFVDELAGTLRSSRET